MTKAFGSKKATLDRRMVQFPFGGLVSKEGKSEKMSQGKARNNLLRKVHFPFCRLKTKVGKAEKDVIEKRNNSRPKEGAISNFDE